MLVVEEEGVEEAEEGGEGGGGVEAVGEEGLLVGVGGGVVGSIDQLIVVGTPCSWGQSVAAQHSTCAPVCVCKQIPGGSWSGPLVAMRGAGRRQECGRAAMGCMCMYKGGRLSRARVLALLPALRSESRHQSLYRSQPITKRTDCGQNPNTVAAPAPSSWSWSWLLLSSGASTNDDDAARQEPEEKEKEEGGGAGSAAAVAAVAASSPLGGGGGRRRREEAQGSRGAGETGPLSFPSPSMLGTGDEASCCAVCAARGCVSCQFRAVGPIFGRAGFFFGERDRFRIHGHALLDRTHDLELHPFDSAGVWPAGRAITFC